MRAVRVVGAAAVLLALGGCGTSTVTAGTPSTRPYAGPLTLRPDVSDDATPSQQSGAAGLALECTAPVYRGGGGDYADGGLESVQGSPAKALANWLREEGSHPLPTSGYRVERDDGDRVLLSYDVHGRTKVAFVVADGIRDFNHDRGWGVESWAQCDPSELPGGFAADAGLGVWRTASGARVPVSTVRSVQGPRHCDWQDITFLYLGPSDRTPPFVRDAAGELDASLTGRFDGSATLPAGATDTGYRRAGRELWLGPDRQAAYVVSLADRTDVERWPVASGPIGCA